MNQFAFNDAVYFTFNGVSSKNRNLRMQTIDDNSTPMVIGMNRTPKEEEGVRDIKVFKGMQNDYVEISITIVKATADHKLLSFTEEDLFEINRWLFKEEYLPFYTDKSDLQYYVVFTKAEGSFYGANQGYINLTMKCLPTPYSPIFHREYNVKNTFTFEVLNKTDVDHKIYPDLIVKMKSGNSFKITNLTNLSSYSISGLVNEEEFEVLGDRRFSFSHIDSKRNLYMLTSKTFLHMGFGRNIIKIETNGECYVEFIYQMRMGWK